MRVTAPRGPAEPFALSPLALSVRQGFEFPSGYSPSRHEALRSPGDKVTRFRSIDVCHRYKLRIPAPRMFPARCHNFRCVDASPSLGLTKLGRRTRRFTTSKTALANPTRHELGLDPSSRAWLRIERGRFLPTAPCVIEPLTSLSPPTLPSRLRPSARLVRYVSRQDRRCRCFIKSTGPFRSRMPSVARDPSRFR